MSCLHISKLPIGLIYIYIYIYNHTCHFKHLGSKLGIPALASSGVENTYSAGTGAGLGPPLPLPLSPPGRGQREGSGSDGYSINGNLSKRDLRKGGMGGRWRVPISFSFFLKFLLVGLVVGCKLVVGGGGCWLVGQTSK